MNSPEKSEHPDDDRPLPEPSLVGTKIADKFEVLEILGSGAMGRVYRAKQTELDRMVAIKVLHAHLGGDARVARRFHREAKAASRLAHPNSVQIVDFGSSAGVLYIVMELLEGEDLQVVIDHDAPFPPARIASILVPVLRAVDEAHRAGIVHRDLKPENIIVWTDRSSREHVKVCDFGIAKIIDGEGSSITVDGFVCGTPQYMAPEQARGDTVDHRLDVYAAGVVLYQMLCGVVPFTGDTALGIITRHLTDDPVPPSERRPDWNIPAALEAIALKAMQKVPADRFESAGALGDAIDAAVKALGEDAKARLDDPALKKHAARAKRSPSRADATDGTIGTRPSAGPVPTDSEIRPAVVPQRPLWPWIAAASVLMLGLGGVAWALSQPAADDPAARAEPDDVLAAPGLAPESSAPTEPGDGGAAELPVLAEGAVPAEGTVRAEGTVPAEGTAPTDSEGVAAPPPGSPGTAVGAREVVPPPTRGAGAVGAADGVREPSVAGARVLPSVAAEPPVVTATPFELAFAEGRRRFLANDVPGAIESFRDAARLSPSSAEVQKQLGRAYMRAGDATRGVAAYRRYLELAPSAPDRAIVEGIIASHSP